MPASNNVVSLDAHVRAKPRESAGPAALDLLGRLFDRFAEDPGIAATVRTELARLRIPTLRAAQLQPDFLANRSHPARELIDTIGAAAAGLDVGVRPDEPTVATIARGVRDLLTDFDADLAPFGRIAARLAAYVEERTALEDRAAHPVMAAIQAREREDASRLSAQAEIARRLRSRLWVPATVSEMLAGPWARALAGVHRAQGEGSPAWRDLVQTMDDLLWSVEPKASAEGRRRLAAMLPGLVAALVAGLRRADVPDADRDAFLSALVDCHATAVRSGLGGLVALPDPSHGPCGEPRTLSRATFSVGEQRVEEVRYEGGHEPAPEPAARLRPGDWLELERGARSPARKRLAWASPATGTGLFVGASPGAMAVTISPAALGELMRRGEARAVDPAPLVERTLAGLLAGLVPPQG